MTGRIEINPAVMLGKPVIRNCDFAVVRALRAAGHDVLAVSEFRQSGDRAEVSNLIGVANFPE
jgi:hypothetical protein